MRRELVKEADGSLAAGREKKEDAVLTSQLPGRKEAPCSTQEGTFALDVFAERLRRRRNGRYQSSRAQTEPELPQSEFPITMRLRKGTRPGGANTLCLFHTMHPKEPVGYSSPQKTNCTCSTQLHRRFWLQDFAPGRAAVRLAKSSWRDGWGGASLPTSSCSSTSARLLAWVEG